ncbi:hypothetical protein V8C86DRAFT_3150668 [Haematococcus lacustris]
MSSCIPQQKDIALLEMGRTSLPAQQAADGSAKHAPATARLRSLCSILWTLLMSALSIAAFILAAWSAWKLHNQEGLTSAVLVSSPKQTLDGYRLVVNMFRGTGYWSPQSPMLYARSDHGAVASGISVYVFGGLSNDNAQNSRVLDSLVRYDVSYNLTTELRPMPQPRTRFGWALLDNKIYVFGGYLDANATIVDARTFMYDIATNEWSIKANLTKVRTDVCAGAIGGKVYVAGGYEGYANSADIEVYSPATDSWSLAPARMSSARGDCVAVVAANQLYIMGGTEQISPPGVDCSATWWLCYNYSARVDVFNPATMAVTRAPDMLYARGDFGAAVMDGNRIMVAGGEHNAMGDGISRLLAMPWMEEYSLADQYWTPKAPLPQPRFRFAMVQAGSNGAVYTYGGAPSCPSPDQVNDASCWRNGLRDVLAFSDVSYPGAYLMVRN